MPPSLRARTGVCSSRLDVSAALRMSASPMLRTFGGLAGELRRAGLGSHQRVHEAVDLAVQGGQAGRIDLRRHGRRLGGDHRLRRGGCGQGQRVPFRRRQGGRRAGDDVGSVIDSSRARAAVKPGDQEWQHEWVGLGQIYSVERVHGADRARLDVDLAAPTRRYWRGRSCWGSFAPVTRPAASIAARHWSSTRCTGTPCRAASRSRSSNSGVACQMDAVAMGDLDRAPSRTPPRRRPSRGQRGPADRGLPHADGAGLVHHQRAQRRRPGPAGRARPACGPGRPFFMMIGTSQASAAPAPIRPVRTDGHSRGSKSSTLASSTTADSPRSSPVCARRRSDQHPGEVGSAGGVPGRPPRRRWPAGRGAAGPRTSRTRAATSAMPVGVVSSPDRRPAAASRVPSSTTAGTGTGRSPWAVRDPAGSDGDRAAAEGVDLERVQRRSRHRRCRRSSPARRPRGSAPPRERCRAPAPRPRPASRRCAGRGRVPVRPARRSAASARIVGPATMGRVGGERARSRSWSPAARLG